MNDAPTNHDLHIMLVKLDGKFDSMLEKQEAAQNWQVDHDKKDSERFGGLQKRIDGMSTYATSVALVAGFVGLSAKFIWDRLTGRA